MAGRESRAEGWDYILDLHRQTVGYDNGYWVAIRAIRVEPDEGTAFSIR